MVYQPSHPDLNYDGTVRFENGEDITLRPEYRSESIRPVAEFNRERELAAEAMLAAERGNQLPQAEAETKSDVEVIVPATMHAGDWVNYARRDILDKSDYTLAA